MKISNHEREIINKIQLRSNKLINRRYRAIRKARNQSALIAGVTFCFAATDAIAHKGLMTIFMGGVSLFFMKATELTTKAIIMLKPEYKEILNRAKSINKLKQK